MFDAIATGVTGAVGLLLSFVGIVWLYATSPTEGRGLSYDQWVALNVGFFGVFFLYVAGTLL